MKWVWHHKRTVLSYVAAWVLVSVSLAVVLAALRASSTPIEVIVDSGKPRRPYFTQTQAAIQDVSQVIRALTVSVQNNGSPAEDVVSQLLALNESLDPIIEPLHTKREENANAVGPGGIFSQHWLVNIQQNTSPAFIVFELRYTDALRNETYSQAFFLRFLGSSQDGSFIQQLFNASSDEKTRMEDYLRVRGIPRLSVDSLLTRQ